MNGWRFTGSGFKPPGTLQFPKSHTNKDEQLAFQPTAPPFADITSASTAQAVWRKSFANDVLLKHPTQEYQKPPRWDWEPTNLAPQAQSIVAKMVAAFPFWEASGQTVVDMVNGEALNPTTSDFSPVEWSAEARGGVARSNSAEEGAHSVPIVAGHPFRVQSPCSWWLIGRKTTNAPANSGLLFGITYQYGADTTPFTVLASFATSTGTINGSTNDGGSEIHTGDSSALTNGTEHTVYLERRIATGGLDLRVDNVSVGAANNPSGQPAYHSSGGALGFGPYAGGTSTYSGWDLYAAYLFRDVLDSHERLALERDPFLPIRPYYRNRIAGAPAGPTTYQRTASITCQSTVTTVRNVTRTAVCTSTSTVTAALRAGRIAGITCTSTATALRSAGRVALVSSQSTVTVVRNVTRQAAIASTSTVTVVRGVGRQAAITCLSTIVVPRNVTRQALIACQSTVTAVGSTSGTNNRTATIDCTSTVTAARTVGRTAAISATSTVQALRSAGRTAQVGSQSSLSTLLRIGRTALIQCQSAITATLVPPTVGDPLKSDRASIELGARAYADPASVDADIERGDRVLGPGASVPASIAPRSTKASF